MLSAEEIVKRIELRIERYRAKQREFLNRGLDGPADLLMHKAEAMENLLAEISGVNCH